jgi:hypothetical protein
MGKIHEKNGITENKVFKRTSPLPSVNL